MKVVCLGGGPAGLFTAVLLKQADARHQVTVYERNRPDDTFGFGVVFSDATEEAIAKADPLITTAMGRHAHRWDDIEIHYRGETVVSTGHGFSGLSRQTLLNLLHERCEAAGVELVFGHEVDDAEAFGDFWSTGFVGVTDGVTLSGAWYEFDSFTPGQDLILKRNEAFWGTPGTLDQIVFLQVPDATQQPAALENGDVQVITPQPNPDLVAQIAGMAGVKSEVTAGTTWEHYDFNQANKHLAKLEVRQALALCIDREEIVTTLVAPVNPDAGVLNNRIYVPESPDYVDNSGQFGTRDIAAAKALLEGVGYTMGADGIYVDADGERLALRLGRRDPNPRRQSTNELFAEQCKEAGFELTDDPAEDMLSVRLPASDYDIALFAWVSTPLLSSNTSIYVAGGGQNWNAYANPDLQALFDQANAEFDAAARADLMNQIDQILWDDMATLPLFQFQEMVAFSDTVSGVVFNGPLGVTWNANEWAITA